MEFLQKPLAVLLVQTKFLQKPRAVFTVHRIKWLQPHAVLLVQTKFPQKPLAVGRVQAKSQEKRNTIVIGELVSVLRLRSATVSLSNRAPKLRFVRGNCGRE